MAIVRQITDTVTELSSTYLQSKLPKFMRKILFKYQIKRIEKIIDKIPEDGKITFVDLAEFAQDMYARYYSRDNVASRFENISVDLASTDLYKVNNIYEYGILINISPETYIKIQLYYNIDFQHPNSYECSVIVRTVDRFNCPITYSTRGFTKYQEISSEVINKIAVEDQLSDQAIENFNMILTTLIISIKKYLKSYIGVYDSINL